MTPKEWLISCTGKPTEAQLNFIEKVIAAGGIAGVVRSVEDCEKLINDYKREHAA